MMTDPQTDLLEHLGRAEEAFTVSRVFGEPYEKDGITIIPAARVQGAVGGGGDAAGGVGGAGTGFALSSKPIGAFVLKGGRLSWRPAIDVDRLILGAQIVALTALLVVRSLVKARRKVAVLDMKRRFLASHAGPPETTSGHRAITGD